MTTLDRAFDEFRSRRDAIALRERLTGHDPRDREAARIAIQQQLRERTLSPTSDIGLTVEAGDRELRFRVTSPDVEELVLCFRYANLGPSYLRDDCRGLAGWVVQAIDEALCRRCPR